MCGRQSEGQETVSNESVAKRLEEYGALLITSVLQTRRVRLCMDALPVQLGLVSS